MKGIVYMVVASVFVNIIKAPDPKQVNLALETVLSFDKKDTPRDLAVIDEVQNVLEKIRDAMQSQGSRRSNARDMKFSDFILEAAKILRRYNDEHLEDTFAIINDESRRYLNRDSKLQELLGNADVRRYVNDQLDVFKDIPANNLRRYLDAAITAIENKEHSDDYDILDIGNSLYVGASNKFKSALSDLEKLRNSNDDILEQVLKDTLKSLVFDHYGNLNRNVKEELVNTIKHYLRAYSEKISNGKRTTTTSHKRWGKYANIYEMNTHTTRKSQPLVLQWNDEYYNTVKKNKKRDFDIAKMRTDEIGLTNAQIKKLIKNEGLYKTKKSSVESNFENESSKVKKGRVKSKRDNLMRSQRLNLFKARDETKEIYISDSDKFEIHMDKMSSGDSESHYGTEKPRRAKKIIIEHSNVLDVGLSRKTPGQINISLVSPDRFTSEEANVNTRKRFTVFPATISKSDEYLSLSSEDDRKVLRKNNVNDAIYLTTIPEPLDYINNEEKQMERDTTPKQSDRFDKLIDKLENEIKDLSQQVKYIKNLKIDTDNGAKNNETSTPANKMPEVKNGENSDNLVNTEKDKNELSHESDDKANVMGTFRAQDNSESAKDKNTDSNSFTSTTTIAADKLNENEVDNYVDIMVKSKGNKTELPKLDKVEFSNSYQASGVNEGNKVGTNGTSDNKTLSGTANKDKDERHNWNFTAGNLITF